MSLRTMVQLVSSAQFGGGAQIACDIQLALIISMSVEAAPGAFNVAFTSYSGWIPWPTDLAGTAPSAQEVTIMLRNAAVGAQDPGLP